MGVLFNQSRPARLEGIATLNKNALPSTVLHFNYDRLSCLRFAPMKQKVRPYPLRGGFGNASLHKVQEDICHLTSTGKTYIWRRSRDMVDTGRLLFVASASSIGRVVGLMLATVVGRHHTTALGLYGTAQHQGIGRGDIGQVGRGGAGRASRRAGVLWVVRVPEIMVEIAIMKKSTDGPNNN